MGKKLYVGNLSFETTSADLEALFAEVGTCESASVITDRDTGRSRGFGFVEMGSNGEAQKAIAALNGRAVYEEIRLMDFVWKALEEKLARSRGAPATARRKHA